MAPSLLFGSALAPNYGQHGVTAEGVAVRVPNLVYVCSLSILSVRFSSVFLAVCYLILPKGESQSGWKRVREMAEPGKTQKDSPYMRYILLKTTWFWIILAHPSNSGSVLTAFSEFLNPLWMCWQRRMPSVTSRAVDQPQVLQQPKTSRSESRSSVNYRFNW